MRISDWSSDVCSSDLKPAMRLRRIRKMEVRRCMIDSVECCNSELKADRCRRLDVLVKRKGPLRHEHDIKTLVSISQVSEFEQRPAIGTQIPGRAEARRVGKESVSTC